MFSEARLKAQMIIKGVKHNELAAYLGINTSTLYRKIKNDGDFSREEISKIVDILGIDDPKSIFFADELA